MLRQPYFFVYSYAEIEGRNFRNRLDFPAEESYNPNAPGERRICRIPRERFRYDHMFDHNRLRRTWRQRRKERQRASFPERKGSNVVHAHVTPGSNAFGTIRPQVRSLSLGPYHVYKKDAREKALQLQGFFAFFHTLFSTSNCRCQRPKSTV